MPKTKIIFMGTPDFAVPALKALAARKNFHISLVVTQPDRPKGRGKKLAVSPVKAAALELGLDLFQPDKINTQKDLATLADCNPDYFVVVAFGQILSLEVLDIPKKYPVNIHGSLLPKYRGAAPIQASILNMDKDTGITTMVMDTGMDTGDMLLKSKTPISVNDTAQDLHDRLAQIGADLILETIDALEENRIKPIPQDHEKATYVKMLKKSDGKIDWSLENKNICAHINAMTPWPGAFSSLNDRYIKIFKIIESEESTGKEPGMVFCCDKEGIHVSCGKKSVIIKELMGSSGKRLLADAFLRGHNLLPGTRFDY
ncbi:MAG: methionyl-tRNA formyltransferase [Desulfobacteraceae bacterium]|nr:methionyl-tRNA formyltransferase [Desulfobacteraceae bacterium]